VFPLTGEHQPLKPNLRDSGAEHGEPGEVSRFSTRVVTVLATVPPDPCGPG